MNLICGINPVLEALNAATRHFDRILIVKGMRNKRVTEAIARAGQLGIPLRFEPRETLDRLAGNVPHQGIIAAVSPKPVLSLDDMLDQARQPALVVVLDGVEDPRNLGAILRTAEGAGADGVVLPERHSAGLSETVARASAGALEHIKVARVGNVSQAIEALKARGIWVVGFDASGTERWDAIDYKGPIALVLGGEGRGIRRLVRERCDHLASLPLFGHVGSLNVSVAAGIALYEVVRQRGVVPSQVRPIPQRQRSGNDVVGPAQDDAESDPGHRARAQYRDDDDEPDAPESEPHAVFLPDEGDWEDSVILPTQEHRHSVRGGPPERARRRKAPGKRPRPRPAEGSGSAPNAPTRAAAPAAVVPGAPSDRPREDVGARKKRKRRRRPGGGEGGAPNGGAPREAAAAPQRQQNAAADAPPTAAGGEAGATAGAPRPVGRRGRRRRRRPV